MLSSLGGPSITYLGTNFASQKNSEMPWCSFSRMSTGNLPGLDLTGRLINDVAEPPFLDFIHDETWQSFDDHES